MPVRATSKAAYLDLSDSGQLQNKRAQIFDFIRDNPGCTRQEICRRTGIAINCVCGRVREMLNSKSIIENGCKHDAQGGRSVNRLYIDALAKPNEP